MSDDILTDGARRVLDVLGNTGAIVEWRPVESDPASVTVVWHDETATRITAYDVPDPIATNGPVHGDET